VSEGEAGTEEVEFDTDGNPIQEKEKVKKEKIKAPKAEKPPKEKKSKAKLDAAFAKVCVSSSLLFPQKDCSNKFIYYRYLRNLLRLFVLFVTIVKVMKRRVRKRMMKKFPCVINVACQSTNLVIWSMTLVVEHGTVNLAK
jgi:hypothetical protein